MKSRTKNIEVKIQDLQFSNQSDIILISGPCQIENEYHALKICEKIIKISNKNGLKFVYKSSFDKANRTSIKSSRGVGIEKGLKILQNMKLITYLYEAIGSSKAENVKIKMWNEEFAEKFI